MRRGLRVSAWAVMLTLTAVSPAVRADERVLTPDQRVGQSVEAVASAVADTRGQAVGPAAAALEHETAALLERAEATVHRARGLLSSGDLVAAQQAAALARAEVGVYRASLALAAWRSSHEVEDDLAEDVAFEAGKALNRAVRRLAGGNYDGAARHAAGAERILGRATR